MKQAGVIFKIIPTIIIYLGKTKINSMPYIIFLQYELIEHVFKKAGEGSGLPSRYGNIAFRWLVDFEFY